MPLLPADHPDAREFAKDPTAFKRDLFQRLRAKYSSLYTDHVDDVIKALEQIEKALLEGVTVQQLETKIQQAADATALEFRSSAAKFIGTSQYWKRTFRAAQKISPAGPAKPYEGAMPKRP